MTVLPMLAASLVLTTSPDIAWTFGPLITVSSGHDVVLAKRSGSPRVEFLSAKQPSRGRQLPLTAQKAFEGDDDSSTEELTVPVRPVRESRFVCPPDMAMIGSGFCIDRYEASLVQIQADGSESPWPYYATIPAGVVVRAVSQEGVYPQGYISGVQAAEACAASGKRLCKPQEWKNACMGPKKTMFPYGNTRETGRCNDNGRSAMHFFNIGLDDKPEHRWMWGANGNMIDPRLNQLEGTLTLTGERASCTNEYGVYDMVGNLHEWVDDPDGTFQGGYYLDTHLNGDGCYYRTTAHPVSHLDYSTGFRCCADVDDL